MTIVILALIMVISMIAIRIGAIAFELTGMSRSQSIFQAVSCYTLTGFTTSESEIVVSHPKRRKIALFLMIYGNVSSVTMIAALVSHLQKILSPVSGLSVNIPSLSIHFQLSPHGHTIARIIELAVLAVGLYYFFMKSNTFSRMLDFAKSFFNEDTFIQPLTEIPVDTAGHGVFVLTVKPDSFFAGKTSAICEGEFRTKNVKLVSLIIGHDVVLHPAGTEVLGPGDRIICIGTEKTVRSLDRE